MALLLARGASGPEVSELQAALNFHIRRAAPLVPDGQFGSLTEGRLKEFQRLATLTPTGTVTAETDRFLYRRADGALEAVLTPKSPLVAFARPTRVGVEARSALFGGILGLGQLAPIIPDFIPPSRRVPQVVGAESEGFDVESKFSFDPLAQPSKGEHPLKLALSIPWPIFLHGKIELEVEQEASTVGKFSLDPKIKIPFTPQPLPLGRLQIKPYFFTGAGVEKDHFTDLNLGAGTNVKLKLFDNIGGTGVSLSVEADGGVKYKWNVENGDGAFKGFLDGAAVLERRF
jgi:hypothetical protein